MLSEASSRSGTAEVRRMARFARRRLARTAAALLVVEDKSSRLARRRGYSWCTAAHPGRIIHPSNVVYGSVNHALNVHTSSLLLLGKSGLGRRHGPCVPSPSSSATFAVVSDCPSTAPPTTTPPSCSASRSWQSPHVPWWLAHALGTCLASARLRVVRLLGCACSNTPGTRPGSPRTAGQRRASRWLRWPC